MCMAGLTKPLFLGRLRHERLTSNQIVGQWFLKLCLEAQAAHLFLLGPNGRGEGGGACRSLPCDEIAAAWGKDFSRVLRKQTMWFSNRFDTNQVVQARKMARGWKFGILIFRT